MFLHNNLPFMLPVFSVFFSYLAILSVFCVFLPGYHIIIKNARAVLSAFVLQCIASRHFVSNGHLVGDRATYNPKIKTKTFISRNIPAPCTAHKKCFLCLLHLIKIICIILIRKPSQIPTLPAYKKKAAFVWPSLVLLVHLVLCALDTAQYGAGIRIER